MKGINKITKITVLVLLVGATVASLLSFKHVKADAPQYMQITTIESIIPGGLGRSRLIVVGPDGKDDEYDMKNLYSLIGINFSNIIGNIQGVMTKINGFTSQGWELVSVTSNSQSPSEKNSEGIFMTRYILKKVQ